MALLRTPLSQLSQLSTLAQLNSAARRPVPIPVFGRALYLEDVLARQRREGTYYGLVLAMETAKSLTIDVSSGLVEVQLDERTNPDALVCIPLRSIQRLGLIVFLASKRLSGANDGWVNDLEILERCPGWHKTRAARGVGKQIARYRGESRLDLIIEAPSGETKPPWRIRLPPDKIQIRDPDTFSELLESSRTHAGDLVASTGVSVLCDRTDFEGLDLLVRNAALSDDQRAQIKKSVEHTDSSVRARALRLNAQCLVQEGSPAVAVEAAIRALQYYEEDQPSAAYDIALCLDTLGVATYRLGQFQDSVAYFDRECDCAQTARERARAMRCQAFPYLRLGDVTLAQFCSRVAMSQAAEAGDNEEIALTRAFALRIRAHTADPVGAAQALQHTAMLIPVESRELTLWIRRFTAEALYLADDSDAADEVAAAVLGDAKRLISDNYFCSDDN